MDEQTPASQRLQRRGLMAVVAALVGAGLGKLLGAGHVDAGHGGAADNVFHLETVNNQGGVGETSTGITTTTTLVGAVPSGINQAVLRVVQLNTDNNIGSVAMQVIGAALEASGDRLGTALIVQGGDHGAGTSGGLGIQSAGGDASSGVGGSGANLLGGTASSGAGGLGVFGWGGSSASSLGGKGVVGLGGAGTFPGVGVEGNGGGSAGAQATGVLGLTDSTANAAVVGRNSGTGPGVHGQSGASGTGNGTGVRGQSGTGIGVLGTSSATTLAAVQGTNTGTGPGVRGQSGATGTGSGTGVHGDASDTAASAVGVLGTAYLGVFGHASQFGVYGYATGAGAQGFHAEAPAGFGLVAVGQQGIHTEGTGALGIEARCASGTALQAVSSSLAGRFIGPVLIEGSFTATGTKSAAVPHPDGSHRRLYCEESTESWFSDYGRARLVNGRAEVRLDPDFDAVVHGDNYVVFLTARGDCKGLHVSDQGPHRFEVRESQGGTSNLAFDYRVVAKRRDIEGRRLERVPMPAPPGRPRVDGIERPQERGRSSR